MRAFVGIVPGRFCSMSGLYISVIVCVLCGCVKN
jgi:hypothetical protein